VSIAGWAFIAVGLLIGGARLIGLRKSRSTPAAAQGGARMIGWGNFFIAIMPIGIGTLLLGESHKNGLLEWTGRCAVTVAGIVGIALVAKSYRAEHPGSGQHRTASIPAKATVGEPLHGNPRDRAQAILKASRTGAGDWSGTTGAAANCPRMAAIQSVHRRSSRLSSVCRRPRVTSAPRSAPL
jgi:hypothetical protein